MGDTRGRQALIETIRSSVIGDCEAFETPFGLRKITYADYTASGRSLGFIEDYIRNEVLTRYANTHTETSGTGRQTTLLREEARRIIREAVKATDDDAVIFCGSGATGAVNKLIAILNLRVPSELDAEYGLVARIPAERRPVVFVGPYEHHSNELPWRESFAEVVQIAEDANGGVDLARLDEMLAAYAARPLKIGSFSAASNITGITEDVDAVVELLHRHGALSFWDYAAAGPYVDIEMSSARGSKDAIFLSPHKFIGGPGTPGILVVKKRLCRNRVPSEPGGGTVTWVNELEHEYLDSIEQREEGGTPAIVGSIRAGLVFQLKEAVGVDYIRRHEGELVQRAIARWSEHPDIVVLGDKERERISIVSFLIRHGNSYLHWNFCVTLLNDLFGIQARGGCSCAGPYGHALLGLDLPTSEAFETLVLEGCDAIRPGWTRINFNYFISEKVCEFLLAAVEFLADHGWKLLPHYVLDPRTGNWRHRDGSPEPPVRLADISYARGRMVYPAHHNTVREDAFRAYLDEARRIVEESVHSWQGRRVEDPDLGPEFERLRWFPLPGEILDELQGHPRERVVPEVFRPARKKPRSESKTERKTGGEPGEETGGSVDEKAGGRTEEKTGRGRRAEEEIVGPV